MKLSGLMPALGAFLVSTSWACQVTPDTRPLAQRLAAAPQAFVGTVTSVAGRRVTWVVHHSIDGITRTSTTTESLPPSTCANAFAEGQRWLYAGPATSDPSVLLIADASAVGAEDFGRLRRADDDRARLPAVWQTCTANAQCVAVWIGCQRTAANETHAAASRAQATRLFGDHRAMNCAPSGDGHPLAEPQCISGRCGHWFVDLRARR